MLEKALKRVVAEQNVWDNPDKKFRYQLLDRLRQDIEYYLGSGGRNPKHLWAGNEKEQIETMKKLYDSFSASEKPKWITLDDIKKLEKQIN